MAHSPWRGDAECQEGGEGRLHALYRILFWSHWGLQRWNSSCERKIGHVASLEDELIFVQCLLAGGAI